jgi:ElaB/YqjD/DUF883 family membrane-anchored ribosome-binding protein
MNSLSVIVILLACCVSVLAVDVNFDITWSAVQEGYKNGRPALPRNISDYYVNNTLNSQLLVDYTVGLLPLITPAVVVAVLSPIAAIIYIIIRCCCLCSCCNKRKKEGDEDVHFSSQPSSALYPDLGAQTPSSPLILKVNRDKDNIVVSRDTDSNVTLYSKKMRVIPSVFYIIFMCGTLAACILGYFGSIDLSKGFGAIQDSVQGITDDTLNLADSLTTSLTGVANQTTYNLNDLEAQLSGVPGLASRVMGLQGDLNSTQLQINNISVQVTNISNSVNLTVLQNLITNMDQITDESSGILGNISSLIGQLNVVSNSSFNEMSEKIDEAIQEVNKALNQSSAYVDETKEVVDTVEDYNGEAAYYNSRREIGYDVMFAVVFAVGAFAAFGFCIKKSFTFHVTAAFGFLFCFILWLIAAVHIILWVVISDACPVIDPVVKSIQGDDEVIQIMHGCLSGNETIFESLDLHDQLNFTLFHEYQAEFINFTNFVNTYNFTVIDDYLDEVNSLYVYNLTALAANLTVQTFGWDPDQVYDGLDHLNQLTEPHGYAYSLQNYTSLNLNDFPADERTNINSSKNALDELVVANSTIYNQLAQTQTQLNGAQQSINTLIANMAEYTQEYNALRTDVQTFSTTNASRAINITEDLEATIDNLVSLGDCSYFGRRYNDLLNIVCTSVKDSLLWLISSILLLGLCGIAIIVLTEVLAARIPNPIVVDGYFTVTDGSEPDFLRTPPSYGTAEMRRRDTSQTPKTNLWE